MTVNPDCQPIQLCELIGGSKLYGLDTLESDIDYRGVFVATDPVYLAGFKKIESQVSNGNVDSVYYEIRHFLRLMAKSNTQLMEILFAPYEAFTFLSPEFRFLKEERRRLFDSETLKKSLLGYCYSEIKLATGQRSGRLGGKRKETITKYGFSPKNFVQILRLIKVGVEFFKNDRYMVNVKDVSPSYHFLLMDIKTNPEKFKKEALEDLVNEGLNYLKETMDKSKIKYTFDYKFASQFILDL